MSCSDIIFINNALYYYRQVKGGTMRSSFSTKKLDRIIIAEKMYKDIVLNYPQLKTSADARYFLSNIQTLMWLPFKKEYIKYYKTIENNIKKVRHSVIRNHNVDKSKRFMALCSYLGILPLRILGEVYRRLFAM